MVQNSIGQARQRIRMGKKKSAVRSIVIFGGAGFIGSNWTERLLKTTTAKVHVFDNLSRAGARRNLEELQELAGSMDTGRSCCLPRPTKCMATRRGAG